MTIVEVVPQPGRFVLDAVAPVETEVGNKRQQNKLHDELRTGERPIREHVPMPPVV